MRSGGRAAVRAAAGGERPEGGRSPAYFQDRESFRGGPFGGRMRRRTGPGGGGGSRARWR